MSRVDKPALKCDRCGIITEDTREMGKYRKLEFVYLGGHDVWDLCPRCWDEFRLFTLGYAVPVASTWPGAVPPECNAEVENEGS